MKYLFAQPANLRFQWELDVVLTNLRALDPTTPIVLLFLDESIDAVTHFSSRYPGLEIHVYHDERERTNYIPTIRPYLVWRYLTEDSERELEDYFQLDSDVIFRELPDFKKMPLNSKICWASDCGGYINYQYLITRQQGQYIVDKFSEIMNIPVEMIRKTPGGGAQWLMAKPTAKLWWHIWQDSQLLYDFLENLDSDVQKWTAEMWAELYNLAKYGWKVRLSSELNFIRPTDPIEDWEKVKILHNAGVVGANARYLFYKGKYVYETPFLEDFNWVDPTLAGRKYAEAIKKVVQYV